MFKCRGVPEVKTSVDVITPGRLRQLTVSNNLHSNHDNPTTTTITLLPLITVSGCRPKANGFELLWETTNF